MAQIRWAALLALHICASGGFVYTNTIVEVAIYKGIELSTHNNGKVVVYTGFAVIICSCSALVYEEMIEWHRYAGLHCLRCISASEGEHQWLKAKCGNI